MHPERLIYSHAMPTPHPLDATTLARCIDHTLLAPDATASDVRRLCGEALRSGFAACCVNPRWVSLAARELAGSRVAVASVCGFPLGANATSVKASEARLAVEEGAREVDMVMALGAARAGRWDEVEADVAAVVAQCRAGGAAVKVILECGLFDDETVAEAARRAVAAGAAFVKTSTGFLGSGATVERVRLLRSVVGDRAGVKASGGIRTLEAARAMLAAGADRLGTSSGMAIVEELESVHRG